MSTWISDLRTLGLAAPLLLSACFDGFGAADAPEVMRVARDSVAIGGPRGYCVDPVGTRDNSRGAFVLMGSCAALNGTARAQHPDRLAVLTATVSTDPGGPRVADSLDDLAAAFATEAGRAMLSRSGDAATVEVIEVQPLRGILFLHLRDSSPFEGPAIAQDYWRAVLDVGDRMVMLSVIPLESPPLGSLAARAILESFLDRVLRENPPRGAPPPQPPAETREASVPVMETVPGESGRV